MTIDICTAEKPRFDPRTPSNVPCSPLPSISNSIPSKSGQEVRMTVNMLLPLTTVAALAPLCVPAHPKPDQREVTGTNNGTILNARHGANRVWNPGQEVNCHHRKKTGTAVRWRGHRCP